MDKMSQGRRVSRSPVEAEGGFAPAINESCHGSTTKVTNHGGSGGAFTIVPIYWGDIYKGHPGPVLMRAFLLDLAFNWPTGLAQYNVGKVWIYPENLTDPNGQELNIYPGPHPAPKSLSDSDIQTALKGWLTGKGIPAPQANNGSSHDAICYVIFMPDTVPAPTGEGGHHLWTTYNANAKPDDLWYSVIWTNGKISAGQSAKAFVDALSALTSHELAEMLTNPYGQGWYYTTPSGKAQCEIGDICECKDASCSKGLDTVSYTGSNGNTWTIEKYWSNSDGACKNPNDYVPVAAPPPPTPPHPVPGPHPGPTPHPPHPKPVLQDKPIRRRKGRTN